MVRQRRGRATSEGTVAGAVFDPNRDELFTATRGGPALLIGPAGEHGRARAAPPRRATRSPPAAARRSARARDGRDRVRLRRGVRAAQAACSRGCCRACATSAASAAPRSTSPGRRRAAIDAYFERSVKQWDIAAGALICERAGLGCGSCGATAAVGILARAAGSGRRAARERRWGCERDAAAWRARPPVTRALDRCACGGWDSNPHALSDRAF